LRPGALQSGDGAFLQPLAFELTQGRQDRQLEPTAGGPEVKALLQRHERDVQLLEILEHRQQVFQVPSNSIQGPAHDHVESRTTRIEEQPIETRPPVLRPAHLVGVFSINDPAPRLAVAPELEKLVLAGLGAVGGTDASIDPDLHGKTAFTFEVIRSPSRAMP